jgi:hypothetical protein
MPLAVILVAVRHHDPRRRRDTDRHRLGPRRDGGLIRSKRHFAGTHRLSAKFTITFL